MTTDAPTPRRPRADAERNRAHIIGVAMACFAANMSATLEDVVAASGLGRTTVFRHFRSRDDLLHAVLHEVTSEFDAMLDEARLDEGSPTEALVRLVSAAGEIAHRLPILVSARHHEFQELAEADADAALMRVNRLFERGQQAGEFRTDVSAAWLTAATHAIMEAAFMHIGEGHAETADLSALVLPYVVGGARQ